MDARFRCCFGKIMKIGAAATRARPAKVLTSNRHIYWRFNDRQQFSVVILAGESAGQAH
jgi:hypothetical protein